MAYAISHLFNLLVYSWRTVGPRAMVHNALRWASDAEARNVDSGFDARYGTDTNAHLTPGEAQIPAQRRRAATMYLPTMDQDLEAMLRALAWSDKLQQRSSFVDMGSGKGRVVCLAAMRRFHDVVGVELSPVLHAVANSNVQRVRAAGALQSPTSLLLHDAASYQVPERPLVLYMYHPFHGSIANMVMQRLRLSILAQPREAAVLYCHPTLQPPLEARVFEAGGLLKQTATGTRETRRFTLKWSVFTNRHWLEQN